MVVFLKDTTASDLRAVVEFMYRGSVDVSQAQLASFIRTAEMLRIRGLSGEDDKVKTGLRLGSGRDVTDQGAICCLMTLRSFASCVLF